MPPKQVLLLATQQLNSYQEANSRDIKDVAEKQKFPQTVKQ